MHCVHACSEVRIGSKRASQSCSCAAAWKSCSTSTMFTPSSSGAAIKRACCTCMHCTTHQYTVSFCALVHVPLVRAPTREMGAMMDPESESECLAKSTGKQKQLKQAGRFFVLCLVLELHLLPRWCMYACIGRQNHQVSQKVPEMNPTSMEW
jgi:hypothetical protein